MFLWMGAIFSFVVVAFFTFDPFNWVPWLPRYPPLFHADRDRIRLGYSILFATAANFLYWPATQRGSGQESALCAVTSLGLIFPVYFALHWAFQPENIFPQWFLNVFYNPNFLSWSSGLHAKRHAMPLQEWLTGLLACCEKAVASKRLVNAEYPGSGEIDCLEFQCEVLYELESRACLVHHKKLLSQDGFREIRRLVQAVDNLEHKSTNELRWPAVLQSARTVLNLRGRLTTNQ
jgi:hypothetical protein